MSVHNIQNDNSDIENGKIMMIINSILVYKLKIQIQISLIIGNLYSAGLIICISTE